MAECCHAHIHARAELSERVAELSRKHGDIERELDTILIAIQKEKWHVVSALVERLRESL
jgi:hypothetical protein